MAKYTTEQLKALIRTDRVHRSIYVDPEIFELEMRKIFGQTWLYVGHESLVPKAGDYYTTNLARQPVVMTRDREGTVHVLLNRCGHRGAKVVQRERGNTRVMSCMYHGWGFHLDGALAGVPMRSDFPDAVLNERSAGMVPLPRLEIYRGFVFASFAAQGVSLQDHLGAAAAGIDELVARSPVGEVELFAGCHKYHYRGNWKLQMDNMADMYHPGACHGSTVGPDGRQFKRRPGNEGGDALFFAPNGEAVVAQTGVRGYRNGHSSEASLFDKEQSGGDWEVYRNMLVAQHGEEQTREILRNKRHTMTYFPSMDIVMAQTAIRVVRPISVDFTEVEIWPLRLKGAPDSLSADMVRYSNLSHAAASFVQTDDLEGFERCHQGLQAQDSEWVLVAKGLGDEIDEGDGVLYGPRSSEVGQRLRHYAWRDMMSA